MGHRTALQVAERGAHMKSIHTITTTALLLLAGSVIPAFGQGWGRERGGDRSVQRSERPRQEQPSGQTQRWQGRERQQNFQQRQNYQPQQNYRQENSRP